MKKSMERSENPGTGMTSFLEGRGMTLKILLLQAAALLVLGVVLGAINSIHIRNSLEKEIVSRGMSLTKNQAYNGKLGMLARDRETLDDMLTGLEEEGLFDFAAAVDPDGEPLSSWGEPDENSIGLITEGIDEPVYFQPEDNPTDLIVFVSPVVSTIGGGAAAEDDIFDDMFGESQESTTGTLQVIGYFVTGMSPEHYQGPQKAALRNNLAATVITVLVMLLLMSILLALSFRPMGRMVSILREIALGEGDLTQRIDISSRDEVGIWAYWFNRFVESLRGILVNVVGTIRSVDDSFNELGERSGPLLEGARSQIEAVEESVASVEEMDRSMSTVVQAVESLKDNMSLSAEAVSNLVLNIKEVDGSTEALNDRVGKINESLSAMKPNMGRIAESVEEIRSSGESTASAMHEMDAAIGHIDGDIAKTADISNKTRELAVDGQDKMLRTIAGMDAVEAAFVEVKTETDALQKQIEAIGIMLTTIQDVSASTKLLSLNAAIIAAQAGEHGKGFGVVATEIQDLSEQTAVSVSEIEDVLGRVQDHSNRVNDTMTHAMEMISEGSDSSARTKDALENIAAGTGETETYVRQIMNTINEQATSTKRINQDVQSMVEALEMISQSAQEQSHQSELIAEASVQLSAETSRVQSTVAQQSHASVSLQESVANIKDATENILNSTVEQKNGSELILKSFTRINDVSEENLQIATAIKELIVKTEEQRSQLKGEVEKFTI